MLEQVYRSQATAVASFDYEDIAEGTGVTVFYGASHGLSGTSALQPFLSKNATYSNIISSGTMIAADSTWAQAFDHDYDVKFNLPKSIKGKLRCTLTLGKGSSGTTNQSDAYAHIKVRHWDGTTETEIADTQSDVVHFISAAAPATKSRTVNVEIDIPTLQHFKRDETLRVTVEIWGRVTGTNSTEIGYAFDPKDRNDDDSPRKIIEDIHTTVMEVHVPFVLDL